MHGHLETRFSNINPKPYEIKRKIITLKTKQKKIVNPKKFPKAFTHNLKDPKFWSEKVVKIKKGERERGI